jgi:hypothetical protein
MEYENAAIALFMGVASEKRMTSEAFLLGMASAMWKGSRQPAFTSTKDVS